MTVTDPKDDAAPPPEPEPAPAETPSATVAPSRRRARWPVLAAIVLAGAMMAAGYYGAGYRFERAFAARLANVEAAAGSAPSVAPADLEALTNRVAILEQRLAMLEAAPAAPVADAGLGARLDAVESALADLAARPAPATAAPADEGLAERIAGLEAALGDMAVPDTAAIERRLDQIAAAATVLQPRLAALETEIGTLAGDLAEGPAAALVVTVGQLRDAARGSAPFSPAFDAVRALVPEDGPIVAILDRLAAVAAVGAPTLDELRASFPAAMEAALAPPVDPDAPWLSRTLDRLAGLVTVRRVGDDVAGDDLDARLARAERALAAGDLAAASADLADSGAVALEDWAAAAKVRVALDAALAELADYALAGFAAAAGP
jgi:uroporphyrinogen-III synthase